MKNRQKNEEKVIAALDALDSAVGTLQKYAETHDGYIDEAALHRNDARAKQLIHQKISVCNLVEQIKLIKSHIEMGAYTASALSKLSMLPDALASCKGMFRQSPNLQKLGNDINAIYQELNETENAMSKLNESLMPKPKRTLAIRLDGVDSEEEESEQFKAEYAAMLERLKGKVGTKTIATPDSANSDERVGTGMLDFAGIIDGINSEDED